LAPGTQVHETFKVRLAAVWAQAALDQKLGTLLRMHEAAFREWGAVPEEILYDRMKTVWLGSDERGEIMSTRRRLRFGLA